MAEFGFELDDIKRLIRLVESRGLERLRVEEEGTVIEILGRRSPMAEQPAAIPQAESVLEVQPAESEPEVETIEERIPIVSPVVGVYYRSPSPDSAPFVEVGDLVKVGQPVGLIEAMKVFSEVVSDHAGIVAEVVARNAALIKQGEVLLYLRPD